MLRSKKVIVEFYLLLWYTPFVISSYTLVHVALALRRGPFFIVSPALYHLPSMDSLPQLWNNLPFCYVSNVLT